MFINVGFCQEQTECHLERESQLHINLPQGAEYHKSKLSEKSIHTLTHNGETKLLQNPREDQRRQQIDPQ